MTPIILIELTKDAPLLRYGVLMQAKAGEVLEVAGPSTTDYQMHDNANLISPPVALELLRTGLAKAKGTE